MGIRARIGTLLLTTAAAAVAGRFAQPPTPGAAPSSAPSASTAPTAASRDGEVTPESRVRTGQALVAEHLGPASAPRALTAVPRDSQLHVCTYVVLVPDPIDSRLDWLFDATVESVRRAFEAPGFVLERFWLPWTLDADSTLRRRDRTHDAYDLRRRHPGVLLFRQASPSDALWRAPSDTDLAVVYLVAETPTGGVRREALQAALDDRDALLRTYTSCAGEPRPAVDELRVVGPMFSGSIESLRGGVSAWLDGSPARHATIVSGGATAPGNRKQMVRGLADRLDYSATLNPVNTLLGTACTVVLDRMMDISPGEVALLVEGSTAFGRAAASVDSATGSGAMGSTCRSLLAIPFPMSISRLRAEYARHPASQPAAPAAVRGPPRLPLDLEDPASAFENPPALSDLTAPALERVMDDIAQTLLAHRVRVAVIVATDVRDRLFVADEIKRRLRDVRLVVIGSHTLFQRPEFNGELRGALVVSTYPLFVENQFWTSQRPSDRNRIVFTNELSEGAYNATLLQLASLVGHLQAGAPTGAACATHGVALTDYRPPFARRPADSTDTAAAHAARRPPVWVTVVGRTTLAPVTMFPMSDHTLAQSDSTRVALGCPPMADDVAEPALTDVTSWELLTLHTGAAAGVLLLLLALREPGDGREPGTRPGSAPSPGRSANPRQAVHDAALHLRTASAVRPLAFAGAAAPLLLIPFRAREHGWPASSPVVGGLALSIYAGIVALLIATLRTMRRHRPAGAPSRGASIQCAMIAVVATAYVVATLAFVHAVTVLDPFAAAAFYTRALQLGSGVSPVTPLVVGGAFLLLWGEQHVRRSRLLCTHFAYEAHAARCALRVREALLGVTTGWHAPGVFVALAVLGTWIVSRLGRSLETIVLRGGLAFDVLHHGLLLVLLTLTAWTAYRFLAVWVALHAELRVLARAAYVAAFERLPRALGGLGRLTPIDRLPQWEVQWMVDELLEARIAALRPTGDTVTDAFGRRRPAAWAMIFGTDAPSSFRSRIDGGCDDANDAVAGRFLKWLRHERVPAAGATPEELKAAEEIGALLAVDYIGWVMRHLRLLALQLLAAVVLTTVFLSSYPFEPQSLIRLVFFAIGGVAILGLLAVLVAANRDPVLSRIANTDPGVLTWDAPFIVNLLAIAAIPLVTLLGSEFPEVRDFLFGWLAPLLKTVGHG